MSDSSEKDSSMDNKPVTHLYDERLRDLERTEHKRKMVKADLILEQAKRKVESARRLYEERRKDDE
jgi:hypothetical protein